MSDFNDDRAIAILNAVQKAREVSAETRRKHVVRNDYGKLFIVPLYLADYEGERHDPGYTSLGSIISESLD